MAEICPSRDHERKVALEKMQKTQKKGDVEPQCFPQPPRSGAMGETRESYFKKVLGIRRRKVGQIYLYGETS